MKKTIAFTLLVLVAGAGAWVACKDDAGGPSGSSPNVILITMDTTRADFLSSQGYPRETTPRLDELARDGVLFEKAMTSSAVTPVSHATILSGLYQDKHGVRVIEAPSGKRLPADTQTLHTVLKERGYRTAAIHSALPVSRYWGFDQGYDVFESFEGKPEDKKYMDTDPETGEKVEKTITVLMVNEAQRRSDETTELVKEYLATAQEPFFLWVHYWDPHDPTLKPPKEFLDTGPKHDDWLYAEELRYMDSQVGMVFDELKALGLYDNSLIAVTADHGEGLTDGEATHGWHAHREVYVEQLHVPLIFKFPAGASGFEPGDQVPHLARTVDIFPTICDYLNLGFRRGVDGESLRGLIEGTQSGGRVHYADQINGYDKNAAMTEKRPKARFIYCVMTDDWKLVYRPTEDPPAELYHIAEDPRETIDLAGETQHDAKLDELMIELARRESWVTAPFPLEGGQETEISGIGDLGYAAGQVFVGAWDWMCPTEPTARYESNLDCPQHGGEHKLVPVARPDGD